MVTGPGMLNPLLGATRTGATRSAIILAGGEGTRLRVHCDVWVEKDDGTRILIGTASATRPLPPP